MGRGVGIIRRKMYRCLCFLINEEFRAWRGWVGWDWLDDFHEKEEVGGHLDREHRIFPSGSLPDHTLFWYGLVIGIGLVVTSKPPALKTKKHKQKTRGTLVACGTNDAFSTLWG